MTYIPLPPSKARTATFTVGPPGSTADYVCTGTNDQDTIQSAINAISAGGQGTVFVKEGTYVWGGSTKLAFNGRKVKLVGAGIGKTTFTLQSGFSSGVMVQDLSTTQGNIEIAGITWNASGKANVGYVHLYQGDNISIHDCEFTGMASPVTSHWAVRIGNYDGANQSGTQSRNVRFCNNTMHDSDTGTNEQLLFINQRDGFVQNNVWRDNTNSNAYELMLYINNVNVDVSRNIFESPAANSIGVMESRTISVNNNQFLFDANYNCVTIINSLNVRVEYNLAENTYVSGTGSFVNMFDRLDGPDGFGHLFSPAYSSCLSIKGNFIKGFARAVNAQTGGTVLGVPYTLSQNNISIIGNDLKGMLTCALTLGVDDVANNLSDIYVAHNNVWSWAGTSTGAIQLRGYTSGVGQMKNIVIESNYITPSSGGANSSAVRAIACTVKCIQNNHFEGTGQGFLAISTATGAVITRQFNNYGQSYGAANQVVGLNSGATDLEAKTITAGSGISVTHGTGTITLAATGSSGGDVSSNTSTSVDSEIALFSGTAGKTIKRATGSGIASLSSGVLSTVTAPSGTILGTTDSQTVDNKTWGTGNIFSGTSVTPSAPASGSTKVYGIGTTPNRMAIQLASGSEQIILTQQNFPAWGALVVALTDAATINTDASAGTVFTVTLGGNRTLANPTNPVDGQKIMYRVKQPASGGPWTLTYGTAFRFSADIPQPVLTTTASKMDRLAFEYNGADAKFDVIGVSRGY